MKMNPRNFFLTVFLFFVGMPFSAWSIAPVIADKNDLAQLCGRIMSEKRWGPPGFGETPSLDKQRLIFFLNFDNPHVFSYKNYAGEFIEGKLNRIQISSTSNVLKNKIRHRVGRKGKVVGHVWSASSEGDYESVVMQVLSITSYPDSMPCDR
ncbi:MAG: hypothetical protein EKK46_02670 [Rhodocyclaceae bacterium]|nr:MAG: hypothetical protein EKK46_02670 [Rhodocyclaceae bacterium]